MDWQPRTARTAVFGMICAVQPGAKTWTAHPYDFAA